MAKAAAPPLRGQKGRRSFRLAPGAPLAEGVRRVAAGRADDALERLERAGEGDPAAAVHEARKDLKKLRSLLRLVRAGLGEQTYRRDSERFRDAGRLLSGARDAEVRRATFAGLADRPGALPDSAGLGAFRAELEADRRRAAGDAIDLEGAIALIRSGRDAVAGWRLRDDGWGSLEPGLRRCYKRGRRAMRAVEEDRHSERVHEWRKRVKDHWYHLRLLGGAGEGPLREATAEAHELSEILGDHHDLALLGERASSSTSISQKDREALALAIDRAQGELLDRGLEIGRRLYSARPKEFARWAAARGAGGRRGGARARAPR